MPLAISSERRRRQLAKVAGISVIWIAGATVGHFSAEHSARSAARQQVKTQVKTETETVYQQKPLPDSCLQVANLGHLIEVETSKVSRITGQHLQNMSDAGLAIFEADQQKLTRLTTQEFHLKDMTDTAIIQIVQLNQQLKALLRQCSADSRS
jgi:beta-phosphoglucomutase-like phosphatase (HAD superfamily)